MLCHIRYTTCRLEHTLGCMVNPCHLPSRYSISQFLPVPLVRDLAVLWLVLHFLGPSLREYSIVFHYVSPYSLHRMCTFAFVGATGVFVQLITSFTLMSFSNIAFEQALPFAVVIAASSNFLVNNWLTFRSNRLRNKALIVGLIKFLLVSSLPIIANVGLATSFYSYISQNTLFSQLAGIIVVFIWNYAASSRLVWNI